MAVFGQQEHGSPLGAVDPTKVFDFSGAGFYDYSGFSSRSGESGFSGFSMSAPSTRCQEGPGIELIPWTPTLIFPLTLDFSQTPYTDDGGLRIRAKDSHGIHSGWSSTLRPFTVANHAPNPVKLIYPAPGQTFDETMTVIWEEPSVGDVDGHPVTYKVEVTMDYSGDTGWITVPDGDAVPRGITSISINTFDFPVGYDFGIRVVPIDEFGAAGEIAKTNFKIEHAGNFLIDTIPPTGTVTINDGSTLVSDTRVRIDLYATDVTSGMKDVRFRNAGEEWGDWDTYTNQKFWDLSAGDGTKKVYVQFRDCAGNISEACDCELISRVMCRTGNVTDLERGLERLYASYDREGRVVEYGYMPVDLEATPVAEVTALALYQNDLYAASYDEDADQTTVYRMRGTPSSVTVVSGKLLSMTAYGAGLYAGMYEGYVTDLFGTTRYPAVGSSLSPVTKVRTDGSVLYATAGDYYVTYNGTQWDQRQV